jgi:hypothetical protein
VRERLENFLENSSVTDPSKKTSLFSAHRAGTGGDFDFGHLFIGLTASAAFTLQLQPDCKSATLSAL